MFNLSYTEGWTVIYAGRGMHPVPNVCEVVIVRLCFVTRMKINVTDGMNIPSSRGLTNQFFIDEMNHNPRKAEPLYWSKRDGVSTPFQMFVRRS